MELLRYKISRYDPKVVTLFYKRNLAHTNCSYCSKINWRRGKGTSLCKESRFDT